MTIGLVRDAVRRHFGLADLKAIALVCAVDYVIRTLGA